MYRVITMNGTEEPWWFFEGWKKDIITVTEFEDFYQALKQYKQSWLKMEQTFDYFKSQDSLLAAFWTPDEKVWCEECAEYLQKYHSLALLEDWHQLPLEKKRWAYAKASGECPRKVCKMMLRERQRRQDA